MTELDELFRAERGHEASPPAGAKLRVHAGVLARVAAGGYGGGGPAMPVRRAIGGMMATGAVGLVVGGIVARAATEPRVVTVERTVQVAVSAPASVTAPPPPPEVLTVAVPSSAAAPANDARGLAAERTLLDAARVAFARGDGAAALDAVGRHEHDFPKGRLAEEREALAVRALAKVGRTSEAKARGERFLSAYPRSLSAGAVRAAIEAPP